MEPRSFGIVKKAIAEHALLDMKYTDGSGRIRERLVAPSKIYVDEGVYYVALCTDVEDVAPAALHKIVHKDMTINKETGEPRIWQILRIARIEEGGRWNRPSRCRFQMSL